MKYLLFALALLLATPAAAQFQKPPGLSLPTVMVPDYNLTISVWAFDTAIVGQYVGVFELHNDGLWYGCVNNPLPDSDWMNEVAAAGGANAWLATIGMGQINEALSKCYPPITGYPGPPPPPNAGSVAEVNYGLQSYRIQMVAGRPVLSRK